jgi:hypothetical protein
MGGQSRFLRSLIAALLLLTGVGILAFSMTTNIAANRDFISYWAAGKQLAHHANPYNGPDILRIQKSAGFKDNRPFFMRNPPTAFFLVLPMGLVSAKLGAAIWSLVLIGCLMCSVRLIWSMHGLPPDRLHLVGYCFPPVLACLLAGQLGIVLLFGFTLFLYFRESRPYLAGVAILLSMVLKPHLFLPFGVVLIAWAVPRKAYPLLIGAGVAFIASLSLGFLLDPSGWTHYAAMLSAARLSDESIPTVSLVFRLLVHRNALWLQFVPALAGCVWAVWYFRMRPLDWMLLLLVSVLVAPYAWFTDEALLLPAILASLYRVSDAGLSLLPFGAIASVALIEVLAGVPLTSAFYVWTAPAWLGWYLYATKTLLKKSPEPITVIDGVIAKTP